MVVKYCKVHLYADDTLLYFDGSFVQDIEISLSKDLENIVGWLNQNYLVLNHSKTKVILMGTYQKLNSVQTFTVSLNDMTFERVYKFKYLGVTLDPNLSWYDHIDVIGNKISSRLGMLRKARKVLPRDACITLFNAIVLPLFDYCCGVWDACGQGNKNFLDRLYKRAAGIIESRKISTDELWCILRWPSLQSRRGYRKCLQVYKCINGLAPAYLLEDFEKFEKYHYYDTCNKDLRLPLARTTKFQAAFKLNAAKTWNTLPANICCIQSFSSFKLHVKRHFNSYC